ncbi:cyclin-dependent kinase inhibitor 5-like [Macadamia integrifolia]|uniref:cyclin-dependent kinase inhibitor 5-like n=1 Tax=Macadamia integrifolia TaxID=60698 RepID=UPI001C4FA137|nr:cyclin-dependent kinase inhibitor 5-like [Macadamia integrifolia]
MVCKLKKDMGKYMKKAKSTGEVAVMEVAQSSLGVRTRAKTLALQRLQKSTMESMVDSGASYLQLRSRRLEKPPLLAASNHESKKQQKPPLPRNKEKESVKSNPNPNSRTSSRLVADSENSCSVASVSCSKNEEEFSNKEKTPVAFEEGSQDNTDDVGIEASFGENVLENEGRDRSTRETTPCSLIRDSDTIGTPGSTTRPSNSTATNRRVQNAMRRLVPTAHEMEEFFASAERQQQRRFIEKYNFDPVNDKPLPGRYEWVRVTP